MHVSWLKNIIELKFAALTRSAREREGLMVLHVLLYCSISVYAALRTANPYIRQSSFFVRNRRETRFATFFNRLKPRFSTFPPSKDSSRNETFTYFFWFILAEKNREQEKNRQTEKQHTV